MKENGDSVVNNKAVKTAVDKISFNRIIGRGNFFKEYIVTNYERNWIITSKSSLQATGGQAQSSKGSISICYVYK